MTSFLEELGGAFVDIVLNGIAEFIEYKVRRRKKKAETSETQGKEDTQERIESDDSARDKET